MNKESEKEEINNRISGQRKYNCLMKFKDAEGIIHSCPEKGRIVGRLGKSLLTYCPHHRKKGERVLNFFINSLMRYKLTNFLRDSKQALFMENNPELCEICYKKIQVFVNDKIVAIDDIEKVMKIEEMDPNIKDEFEEEDEK